MQVSLRCSCEKSSSRLEPAPFGTCRFFVTHAVSPRFNHLGWPEKIDYETIIFGTSSRLA